MLERIKTALILLVIVGACLFLTDSPWPMIVLLSVGGVVAAHEWAKLVPTFVAQSVRMWFYIGFIVLLNAISFWLPASISTWAPSVWALSMAVWVFSLWWVKAYPQQTTWWFNTPVVAYVGVVLIVATISGMFYLWQQSPWWLLYAMGLVWCADTGAYFAGRALGKRKLAPNVSPKKTYEGMVGGLLLSLAVIAWVGLSYLDLSATQRWVFISLSAVAAVTSVLGDLLESMVKRQAGVKDSGTLLPGHGGVLDRIDSMMATVPIFALGYWLWLV